MNQHDVYEKIELKILANEDWIVFLKQEVAKIKRQNAILRRQLYNKMRYEDVED